MTVQNSAEQQQSEATMTEFIENTQASTESLTSSTGKLLARKFDFDRKALISATVYPLPDRRRIVSMLRLCLVNFYVHLKRKEAIYGFDPVQALDLLEPSIDKLNDAEFHQSIVDLVARTRDRHFMFYGRAPIGVSAVLPFTVEQCWLGPDVQYMVTKIDARFTPKYLGVGAVVTHWNGIPIKRYLLLNANVFDGGNKAASLARSIAFLTNRPLNEFASPLEEWVDLTFVLNGKALEERFTWQGFDASEVPVAPSIGRNSSGYGGDFQLLYLQHARRVQFAPKSFDVLTTSTAPGEGIAQITGRAGDFDYGSVTTSYGTFGYIRLWNFTADEVDDIAKDFLRVLPLLPQTGLIIDLRGNSGGYIAAGERLLQLFTAKEISPAHFQFRVTPAVQSMVDQWDEFKSWSLSVAEEIVTGEQYTQGFPIEGTVADANQFGQTYYGPVVLIGDALAFSTADIFTAGFIDNEVGKVICTDENMAAAGGNNWLFDIVQLYNPDFHLDPSLQIEFEAGTLSQQVRDKFNQAGASLSEHAVVSAGIPEDGGTVWVITDGSLTHLVRSLPDDSKLLCAYVAKGNFGLQSMPSGIIVSLTMRRCIRVGKNEGQVLEDLGIRPNIIHRMTPRDVLESNQDLNIRASQELSKMPAYDLKVEVKQNGQTCTLICTTLHLDSLEVFAGSRYLSSASAHDNACTELSVPNQAGRLEIRGLVADVVAARRMVVLTSESV